MYPCVLSAPHLIFVQTHLRLGHYIQDTRSFNGHERSNKGQDHLWLHLDNILREDKNGSSKFTGNANGVLGIHACILLSNTRRHEVIVDNALLHATHDVEKKVTRAQGIIPEARHACLFAGTLRHGIGPFDHVGIRDILAVL